MDGLSLQDKINRGMGVAARKLGSPFIVYRPGSSVDPLCSGNRVIKLFASFNSQDDSYRHVSSYGEAIWWGVYDASYTRPGDYLAGSAGTFFVCAQRPLLPVQCVLTNRVVTIRRPAVPSSGGYSGMVLGEARTLLEGWPAGLLEAGPHGASGLPRETRLGSWSMLLPALPVSPQASDIVTDDLSASFVVGAAEQTGLGWRLLVRQVAA